MGPFGRFWFPASLGLAMLLSGCQWSSPGKLAAEQSQNRALVEQTQAQLREIENLRAHNRTIENQLIQAEEELAELDARRAERKQISNYQHERRTLRGQVDSLVNGARGEAAGRDLRLEEISRRHDWLDYDPQLGVSRFDTDVLFESGEAELHDGARPRWITWHTFSSRPKPASCG